MNVDWQINFLFQNFFHKKAVLVEKRIERPAIRRTNIVQHSQADPNFDYRNFFDFGFFSNAAANYGGAAKEGPNTRAVYVEKRISPNNVVYEKRTNGHVPSPFSHQDDGEVHIFLN